LAFGIIIIIRGFLRQDTTSKTIVFHVHELLYP